jgi:hypothetical protein
MESDLKRTVLRGLTTRILDVCNPMWPSDDRDSIHQAYASLSVHFPGGKHLPDWIECHEDRESPISDFAAAARYYMDALGDENVEIEDAAPTLLGILNEVQMLRKAV